MSALSAINLHKYTPVEPLAAYTNTTVLETGSRTPSDPLPQSVLDFVRSLGHDVTLWDASSGVLGRDYNTHKPEPLDISPDDLVARRRQYRNLRNALANTPTPEKLLRDVRKYERSKCMLNESIAEVTVSLNELQRRRDSCEIDGARPEEIQQVEDCLNAVREQLATLNTAKDRVTQKLLESKVNICESETGFVRRLAMLRCMFSDSPRQGILTHTISSSTEALLNRAAAADELSRQSSIAVFQMKCFYLDAVRGRSHLYKVETTIKNILEHLRLILSPSSDQRDPIRRPNDKTPDFRLRYVRRMWGTVEDDFKAVLPYIQETSLRVAAAESDCSNSGGSVAAQFYRSTSGKKQGIFQRVPCLLASASRIEFAHPLSKQMRITAMHRSAASAYREINRVYDAHERLLKEALDVLTARMEEDRRVNTDLIDKWEALMEL